MENNVFLITLINQRTNKKKYIHFLYQHVKISFNGSAKIKYYNINKRQVQLKRVGQN